MLCGLICGSFWSNGMLSLLWKGLGLIKFLSNQMWLFPVGAMPVLWVFLTLEWSLSTPTHNFPSHFLCSVPHLPFYPTVNLFSGPSPTYLRAPCWPSTQTPVWASSLSPSRLAEIAAPHARRPPPPRRPRPQLVPSWVRRRNTAPCCAWSLQQAAPPQTAWAATAARSKAAIATMAA